MGHASPLGKQVEVLVAFRLKRQQMENLWNRKSGGLQLPQALASFPGWMVVLDFWKKHKLVMYALTATIIHWAVADQYQRTWSGFGHQSPRRQIA